MSLTRVMLVEIHRKVLNILKRTTTSEIYTILPVYIYLVVEYLIKIETLVINEIMILTLYSFILQTAKTKAQQFGKYVIYVNFYFKCIMKRTEIVRNFSLLII
jgi:hypothetical protein